MASSREEYDELVKKNIAKRKEVVKEIKDLKGQITANNQDLLIEKTKFETESTKITEKAETTKTKVIDEEAEKRKSRLEQDRIDLINAEQEDIERWILNENAQAERQRIAREDKKKAEEEYLHELVLMDDQAREDKKVKDANDLSRTKQISDAKWKMARESFEIIGNFATLFAGKSLKEQKRAFEIQKAANIGIALMDTYKGATAAFASGSEINPIFGAVSAAAAVAAGLVNVKNISNQQFSGGSTGGSAPSPSMGGGGEQRVITPNFNIIGNQNQSQLSQLNQAPIKAYVVGSDVTTQQMLDKKKIQNATL